jgi:hypothetical protein
MPVSLASFTGERKASLMIVLADGKCNTATMNSQLGISSPENAFAYNRTVQLIISLTLMTALANAYLITPVSLK